MTLLLLLACVRSAGPVDPGTTAPTDSGPNPDPTDTADPDPDTDTDTPPGPVTLPEGCVAADNGPPPLTRLGADDHNTPPNFMEIVDIELDGDLAYATGQGGYIPVDVADPAAPEVLFLDPDFISRMHRVERVRPGLLAGANRDDGLSLLDVSTPASPRLLGTLSRDGWEGLAAVDELLYVASRTEGLVVVDVSDPARPEEIAIAPGLPATWELADPGDGWLYAADSDLGVVPIDLADPTAPVVGDAVAMPGATYHAVADAGYVYAAVGGHGVVILDRSDPARPEVVATVPTGGTVVSVALGGTWLYAADHEGLQVIDVSDPAHPVPWTRAATEMFALAVAADADHAYVGDWGIFETWAVDGTTRAPALTVDSPSLVRVDGVARGRIANRGAGTLVLSGATTSDGSPVVVGTDTLGPGEETWIELTGSGPLDVCVATNDPSTPTLALTVDDGGELPVGIHALDFSLEDLDGNTWTLSEHIGSPVFITFFATW